METGFPRTPEAGSAKMAGDRGVSLGVAVAIVAGTVLVIAALATFIGYRFFWEKYALPKRLDVETARWEQRLKQNPKDDAALAELGVVYFQKGDLQQAEAYLQKALKINKDNPAAAYHLGLIYMSQKKFADAEKEFKKLTARYPTNPLGFYQLALAYFEQGKLDAALEKLKFINDNIDGTISDVYHLTGQIYERKNMKDKAIASYRRAAEFDPNFKPAVEALQRLGVTDLPKMPAGGAHAPSR